MENKPRKRIGSWIFAVIFILTGLSSLLSSDIAFGLIMLLAGVFLLPPLNVEIEKKLNRSFKWYELLLISVVVLVIAGMLSSGNIEQNDGEDMSDEEVAAVVEESVETDNVSEKVEASEGSASLGFNAASAIVYFESLSDVDFDFEESPLQDGTPRALAQSDNIIMEITGDEPGVLKMTYSFFAVSDDVGVNVQSLVSAGDFLDFVDPTVVESGWLAEQTIASGDTADDYSDEMVRDGVRYEFQKIASLGMFLITISPASTEQAQ